MTRDPAPGDRRKPCKLRETQKNWAKLRQEAPNPRSMKNSRSRALRFQEFLRFVVIRRGVHVPEQASGAIKSLPSAFVNNFHLELFHRFGDLASATVERALQPFCPAAAPASAQRLETARRPGHDHLSAARQCPLHEIIQPLTRKKRHVAPDNQVPFRAAAGF